ncbi:unnamed protein product [Zymoseptoria tritici ST99CH_3D1]|uniref:MHYT domain-containing protein n=1 Tax=Zymoseptoria tritici ST99CH_1E4 TaxID=1276532 RepID=A0A2H1H5H2_ZYMTR|nr:unnamed protein product [Zymoseptoria tritici ST99CH_1E4]SMR64177.1 unnamed protein product [Zymoseptoria tritici ST99CH_3D1]
MSEIYGVQSNIPSTFDAGIVAGSYFASLCGCILTIEILHRRGTALRNWRSWVESLACAISMGLVGIWCMHFIGNRAIVLGNGDPSIQLVYASNWTVLSVFLPVIGLTIAFSAAEFSNISTVLHWIALTCTGVIAGLAVVSMHYLGNKGITNYVLNYHAKFLVASVVISIGDCWLVLLLFYRLRERWISSWWKRLLCAALLAGGVSAMHFTASTSCEYKLLRYNDAADLRARETQVLIAAALCGAAAVLIVIILLVARRRDQIVRRRSQKVMLACVMFDPDGRVLVTTDGVLPSREITDKYNHRTFNDDFDTAHPVFLWIYRVTHNWASVVDLIPRMRSHLHAQADSIGDDSRPISSPASAIYDADTYNDYEILFRERFCTAAASIASTIHFRLDQLGVLYDQIIQTGTLRIEPHHKICIHKNLSSITQPSIPELEAALHLSLFGKGQLMFITRTLNAEETHRLLNGGFRFAYVEHVGRNIAHAMQIPLATLIGHFAGLKRYVSTKRGIADKPGTWLTIFAMSPKTAGKGFDVVVKKDARDLLPDVPLFPNAPSPEQIAFLSAFDGLRATQILSRLAETPAGSQLAKAEETIADPTSEFRQAIPLLFASLPSAWVSEARFYAKPLHAYYTSAESSPSSSTAGPLDLRPAPATQTTTIFAFTAISDLHTSHLLPLSSSVSATSTAGTDSCTALPTTAAGISTTLTRIPRTFFEVRYRCTADSSLLARRQRLRFKREVHDLFVPIFAKRVEKRPSRGSSGSMLPRIRVSKKGTGLSREMGRMTVQSEQFCGAQRGKAGSIASGSGITRTSASTADGDTGHQRTADRRELLLGSIHAVGTNASGRSSPGGAQKGSRTSSAKPNQDPERDHSSKGSKIRDHPLAVMTVPTEKRPARPSLGLPRISVANIIRVRNRSIQEGGAGADATGGTERESSEMIELDDEESDLTFVDELVAVTKARFGVGTMVNAR